METIRAFIAVDIGDTVREKLEALQRELKKIPAEVRWTNPRSIHLTLAFLGGLPADQIPLLKTALDEGMRDQASFDLEITGTGFFGRRRQPRVLWTGMAGCAALMELQRKTAEALHSVGIEFDDRKPFSPHLTLGRIKKPGSRIPALLKRLEDYAEEPLAKTRVDAVELIQSMLKPDGPAYTVLHRIPLSRSDVI